jgi:hypothetical protein
MFLYKFGYGSYEESNFYEICHKKQFSEKEFTSIIADSIIKVLYDCCNGINDVYIFNDGISYEDIHEYVFEELKKIGFEKVEYEVVWSCFGWPSLTNKNSWGKQRGNELNEIFWKIPDDIKNTINVLGKNHERERSKEYDMRYRKVLYKNNNIE